MRYTKENYIARLTKDLEHRTDWVAFISDRIMNMPIERVKWEMTVLYGSEKECEE